MSRNIRYKTTAVQRCLCFLQSKVGVLDQHKAEVINSGIPSSVKHQVSG